MHSSSQVSPVPRYGFPCRFRYLALQESDTTHYGVQSAQYGTWQLLDKDNNPLEGDNLLRPLGLSESSNKTRISTLSRNPPLKITEVWSGESAHDPQSYLLSSPSMAKNIRFEPWSSAARFIFKTTDTCDPISVDFVDGLISFEHDPNKGEGGEDESKDKSRASLRDMMRDGLHHLRAPAGLLKEAATRSAIGRVYQEWKRDSAKGGSPVAKSDTDHCTEGDTSGAGAGNDYVSSQSDNVFHE